MKSRAMYVAIVALLMFVLPVGCAAAEVLTTGAAPSLIVLGKWFAVWTVGARLSLAGLRQVITPRYTAEVVLGIKGQDALILVRELGFANIAIGLLGIASFHFVPWRAAAALAGGVFYALAGLNHVFQRRRTSLENVAMASDLWGAAVLLATAVPLAAA